MKLIKAHIINFGKLHDFDIDFNDKVNSFVFENGWGKTTLSVFIKAMFYGMDHTTKKNLDDNELKKYAPWQGGQYGGSLTFSYKNRDYIVSRTFSTKKNEDTVEIRDLQTNKVMENFSDNLGSFLFGVNRDTYERSVHVTLDETPAGSTDISAKLNNLLEAGDVSSFDDASKALDARATALKAKRGNGGEISELQNRIDFDRKKLSEIDAKILQNEEYEKMISAVENDISSLKEKQDSLGEELSVCAKYESKLRYEELKQAVEDAKSARTALLDFFNGQLPEPEVIKTIDSISSDYTTLASNIKNNSASQTEKDQYKALQEYFAGNIPSKDEIESCIKTDDEYKNFRRQESEKKLTEQEGREYEALKGNYDDKDISDEKIKDCINSLSLIQGLKEEEGKLNSRLQEKNLDLKISQQTKLKNVKRIVFISLAAASLLASLAVFFLVKNFIISGGILAAVILFALLGIFSKSAKPDSSPLLSEILALKKELSELEAKRSEKENLCKAFISQFSIDAPSELLALNKISLEYDRYKILSAKQKDYEQWISSCSKVPADYEKELKLFVKQYCKTDDISSVPSEIQILNNKLNRLSELEKKIQSDSNNSDLQEKTKDKLEKILNQYKTQKALSFAEQVQELHNKINDMKNADANIESAKNKLHSFEADFENDLEGFENIVKPEKSTNELQAELSAVTDEITEKNATVANYRKIISDNLTDTERKEDVETEIERLVQEKEEKTSEHSILLKTLDFLTQAKEKLDANYSDPMKEGFAKYVKMLDGKLKLVIDTDLKVSLEEDGRLHESDYLSAGYKDLVNFCSRMALVDALYTEEVPPLILDDPFVNLDDSKVPSALKLVKDMGEEKQILYFACHESRKI